MALQYSVGVRNAKLDAVETHLIGAFTVAGAPILMIRTGAVPANCAAANTGTVLATLNLPGDPFANAGSGTKAKTGTWEDLLADASGTAGHFRVYNNDGTTCHIQGTVTATGGGGDMTVNNTSFAANQPVTVTGFTITAGNA